jgi:hypothetical protein
MIKKWWKWILDRLPPSRKEFKSLSIRVDGIGQSISEALRELRNHYNEDHK